MASTLALPVVSASAYAVPADLDNLRLKLVQLIDAISTLQSLLHYASISTPQPSTARPGLPNYSDLLTRYNILLSHIGGLGAILSSLSDEKRVPEKERDKDAGTDKKKDEWDSNVVVPAVGIEEAKEWIVGVLLRTKQTPPVEDHQAKLLASLPPAFSNPETSQEAITKHSELVTAAFEKIQRIKEGLPDEDGDWEEWSWKARVKLPEEEEDEEEGGDDKEVEDVEMR
ncbi:hypothetical protein T439DRAFT_305791 [Meredithblackwellia eburnea MCA 4105]